jgi:low temperature requirement protein LtrA
MRVGRKLLACLNCFLAVLVNRFAYLFLKNAGGKKIKNKGSAMSACLFGRQFGLLVARLKYGLYVVVHLSKFVSLFSVFTRSMSNVSCRYTLTAN